MDTHVDATFEQTWSAFARQPYYQELASAGAVGPLVKSGELLGQLMIPITWLPMRAWTTEMLRRGLANLNLALREVDRATALIVLDTVEELVVFAVDAGALAVNAGALVLQLHDYWEELASQ